MRFSLLFCFLIASSLTWGQAVLNEVVSNDPTLADAEGDYPDWIEIYNSGATEINLRDSFLSDDGEDLTKWQFSEDQIIPAGAYLIVFASGKDTVINGEPHTNFKLSAGGEALVLIAPDGITILSEFPEGFPRLVNRQPFGRIETADGPDFGILEYATPRVANSGPILTAELGSFTASVEMITEGQGVTLSWTGAEARSLSIYGTHLPRPRELREYFQVQTFDVETGSFEVFPAQTTFYEFRAQNSWSEVILKVEVKVLPSLASVSLKPDLIVQGGRTVIRWETGNPDFELDLNDGFGLRTKSPSVYTPFNEVLLSRDSEAWKTKGLQEDDLWQAINFDDSGWEVDALPIELGFDEQISWLEFQVAKNFTQISEDWHRFFPNSGLNFCEAVFSRISAFSASSVVKIPPVQVTRFVTGEFSRPDRASEKFLIVRICGQSRSGSLSRRA